MVLTICQIWMTMSYVLLSIWQVLQQMFGGRTQQVLPHWVKNNKGEVASSFLGNLAHKHVEEEEEDDFWAYQRAPENITTVATK